MSLVAATLVLLVVSYMAVLFVLSSTPRPLGLRTSRLVRVVEWVPPRAQKIMHVLLYGGLAWLWFYTLIIVDLDLAFRIGLAFALTVGYGALNEWHQLRVEGRYGSLNDILLNSIGAVLGLLTAVFCRWSGAD